MVPLALPRTIPPTLALIVECAFSLPAKAWLSVGGNYMDVPNVDTGLGPIALFSRLRHIRTTRPDAVVCHLQTRELARALRNGGQVSAGEAWWPDVVGVGAIILVGQDERCQDEH